MVTDRTPSSSSDRRRTALTAVLLSATVLTVSLLGPSLMERVSDALRHDPGAPFVALPAEPGDVAPDEAATGGPVASAPRPVPATAAPAVGDPPAVGSPLPTAGAEVARATHLQMVPPRRDVIVDVGGRRLASDANGRVALPAVAPDTPVQILGVLALPMLQSVEFVAWADGATDATRSIGTLGGPVVDVGLLVSSRVTATAGPDARRLVLESTAGEVEIPVGDPTWVPATRAVVQPGGFVVEEVAYSARTIVTETAEIPVGPQAFVPTPEAIWAVV